MLVARRELIVRVRSTAFRVSTIILLAVTVAGIAITAALTGHPQRFTVAVTAQAPPAVAAAVRADGNAAGLQVTVVTAAGRAAAVRSVEQGRVTAAVDRGEHEDHRGHYLPGWNVHEGGAQRHEHGLLRVGARLYQNAVLHTGARLRLREAWPGEPPRPQPARR